MPSLELTAGAQVVLEAINPTTGAAVGGVVALNMVVYGKDLRDDDPATLELEGVYVMQSGDEGRNPADFGGPAG